MLLTIEERSPLFLDKQETTMTSKTRLLALVTATSITTSLLAGTALAAGHSNRANQGSFGAQANQGVSADKQPASSTTRNITRGQLAVFVIRAKMNNVFPTSLSGVPLTK